MSAKAFTIGGHTISYGGFLLREAGAGALTITKTVTGTGFDASRTFAITITFDKAVSFKADGVSVGPVSSYTMHLHHNQSCALTEIPELTQYEVTEELTAEDRSLGYSEGMISGGSGSATAGTAHTCGIENAYIGAPGTAMFKFSNLAYDPTAPGAFPKERSSESFTWTQVSANPNIWMYQDTRTSDRDDWSGLFDSGRYHFKDDDTGDMEVLSLNLTGVVFAGGLFTSCLKLKRVHLITGTSALTDTYLMFCQCEALESVPLFDTSSVVDMHLMFSECLQLTSVPLYNTSNAEDMSGMFWYCPRLTSVPAFDTAKAKNMFAMFTYCSALKAVPLFSTSNVTDMAGMFAHSGIENSPLFDTRKVADMSNMFGDCASLKQVPLLSVASVTDVSFMFGDCTGVKSGALAMYNQLARLSPSPSHLECFKNCGSGTTTGAAELAQIPSGWK